MACDREIVLVRPFLGIRSYGPLGHVGDEIWLSLLAMRNMMRSGASFMDAFSGRAAPLAFREV